MYCTINYDVVGTAPDAQRVLLQFFSVMHLQLINSLLNDASYVAVAQVEVGAVQLPQRCSSERAIACSRSRTVSHPCKTLIKFRPVYKKNI